MKYIGMIFLGLIFLLFAAVLYVVCSPMPVVKMLRRNGGEDATPPEGYGDASGKVEVHRDLVYPSAYRQNQYDLYLPKAEGKCPLILWVHGGAFVAGDKSGVEIWATMLASRGYAVASMNYCWAPEASYPAQIVQVSEALRALCDCEFSHRLDLGRIAVAGDSAGAYMAVQFALAHTNPELAKRIGVTSPIPENALKCALLYCGPYDVKKMFSVEDRKMRFFISRIGWSFMGKKNWKKAPLIDTVTPFDFVTERAVPCYITDGNAWSFQTQGMDLGKKLREKGVTVRERYFPKEKFGNVNHEYQMQLNTENGMDCFGDTLEFLSDHLNPEI